MRIVLFLVLIIVSSVMCFQIFQLFMQRGELQNSAEALTKEQHKLETENQKLKEDISYFGDAHNLTKEIRALFNYRKPGEELMIVVPKRIEGTTTPIDQ